MKLSELLAGSAEARWVRSRSHGATIEMCEAALEQTDGDAPAAAVLVEQWARDKRAADDEAAFNHALDMEFIGLAAEHGRD